MDLTVYLLRTNDKGIEGAIRDDVLDLDIIELEDQSVINGVNQSKIALVIGPVKKNEPRWLSKIEEIFKIKLSEYYNQSTRAAILVDLGDYIIAYTFGYGRYLLNDDFIVKDFGIRFVLNVIDPEKLKGLEKITLNEYMLQSRQLAGREVSINSLDLDTIKDIVKRISGQPYIEKYGTTISGSDSLFIKGELDEINIMELSRELFDIYSSDRYKLEFGWYDNIQAIKDKSIIAHLYKLLIDELKHNNSHNAVLLLPEVNNELIVNEISFTEKGKKYDYNIKSIVKYFEDKDRELTFNNLEKMYIYINDVGSEEVQRYRILDCICFETVYKNTTYFHYQREWYKVSNDFFNEVMNYLRNLPESTLYFIDCKREESEEEYIKRLCGLCNDYLLMDQKCVQRIEVCDILTKNKELVHIKPWRSSSTLSHLLSQGRVSSDLLLNDMTFRINVINKIKELDPSFYGVIKEPYTASDYKVIFAVIYKEDKPVIDRLPFFSKINLKWTAQTLIQMGYQVELKRIKRL